MVSARALQRATAACEAFHHDLLGALEQLRFAALPDQPQPPAQQPQREQEQRVRQRQLQPGARNADSEAAAVATAAGSRGKVSGEEGNEYQQDSWLVGDKGGSEAEGSSSDAEMEDVDAAGYTSASEELPAADEAERGEVVPAEQQPGRAWNAAGLAPGQTRVLVAPGMAPPREAPQPNGAPTAEGPQPEARLKQQAQAGQQLEGLAEPAASLPATEVAGAGAAGGGVDSPATQPAAPALVESPLPSPGAVANAMQLAGEVMGGIGSDLTDALPAAAGTVAAASRGAVTSLEPAIMEDVDEDVDEEMDDSSGEMAVTDEEDEEAGPAAEAGAPALVSS